MTINNAEKKNSLVRYKTFNKYVWPDCGDPDLNKVKKIPATLGSIEVLIGHEAILPFDIDASFTVTFFHMCALKYEIKEIVTDTLPSWMSVDKNNNRIVISDSMVNSDFTSSLVADRPTTTFEF